MTDLTEWRKVPGLDSRYEVSADGRVRNSRVLRLMALSVTPSGGYMSCNLICDDGVRRTKHVHTLVAAAFIGPRPPGAAGQHVRHLDGDPKNNTVENLAYGSAKENVADTFRMGRRQPASPKQPALHLSRRKPVPGSMINDLTRAADNLREAFVVRNRLICEANAAGASLQEIANATGMSNAGVSGILARDGVVRRISA